MLVCESIDWLLTLVLRLSMKLYILAKRLGDYGDSPWGPGWKRAGVADSLAAALGLHRQFEASYGGDVYSFTIVVAEFDPPQEWECACTACVLSHEGRGLEQVDECNLQNKRPRVKQ